jgi:hypothetical protein
VWCCNSCKLFEKQSCKSPEQVLMGRTVAPAAAAWACSDYAAASAVLRVQVYITLLNYGFQLTSEAESQRTGPD